MLCWAGHLLQGLQALGWLDPRMQPFALGACQWALPEKPRWKLCWTEAGRLRIALGRPSTSSAAAFHEFMGLQVPEIHVPELGEISK